MQEITQFINSVGFPIVACVFMYKQQIKTNQMILDLTTTLKGIDTRLEGIEKGGV